MVANTNVPSSLFYTLECIHLFIFYVFFFVYLLDSPQVSYITSSNTATSNVVKTALQQEQQHCIVVIDNRKVVKQIGSIWKSPENPCNIHLCDTDEQGRAQEIITIENCQNKQCAEVSDSNGTQKHY